MKKKIVGILICILVSASVVVSAAGIMNTATTKSIESRLSSSSAEKDSGERGTTINKQNDIIPQPADTKTGFLSIPAAAFNPEDNTMTYEISGLSVRGIGSFYASVYLPNEVTVTKLTFYWVDLSESKDGELLLMRSVMGEGYSTGMARVETIGSDGSRRTSWDDEIALAKIDNSKYGYHLILRLDSGIYCYNVLIEYTYETGGSSVDIVEGQHIHEPNVLLSR